MENISFTHEDIVSDLNFLLNDKAQWALFFMVPVVYEVKNIFLAIIIIMMLSWW